MWSGDSQTMPDVVSDRFKLMGFSPRHPVALFNSLSGCVIEVVESANVPRWEASKDGGALWVDVAKVTEATIKNVTRVGHTKTARAKEEKWKEELLLMVDSDEDGNVDPHELLGFLKTSKLMKNKHVQKVINDSQGKTTKELLKDLTPVVPEMLSTLVKDMDMGRSKSTSDFDGSTEFAKHMQLVDGWKDPPGIKVRPRAGVGAMECLVANDPTGIAAKLGAALMLGVTKHLRAIGYEEGKNLRGYGYDWRMPCTKMEERDNFFSKTMEDMENLVSTNGGEKIVVVTHSLGGVCACYFFHWVVHSDYGRQKGGIQWLEGHIHAFIPIGGPMLGTPYGSASYLSGDEGQGLAPAVFSYDDRHLVIRSWGMFGMIFPTGRHLMLQPTHSVHWVRQEGVLNVHLLRVQIKSDPNKVDPDADQLQTIQYYVQLGFHAPVTGEVHTLRSSPHQMLKEAAIDQRFQFVWSAHPKEIEDASLTISLIRDRIGPIDKESAKGSFSLSCKCIRVKGGSMEGTELGGLMPNDWREYEFKLTENCESGIKEVIIGARLRFVPFNDTELFQDFSRSAEEDPGAWRCGGPADNCSTQEKRERLIEQLGEAVGTEWRPEVKKDAKPNHKHAAYSAMNIDQVMVYDGMKHEYKCWKECYADDKIWRSHSTEPPQGVRRILPIYGINVPTLVGNVYRRQTKRFERYEPSTTLKLDKHCQVEHPGYKIANGIVEEVPSATPQADDPTVPLQDMTFNTRASGDGTVAYWSLRWPITWRSSGITVEPVEVMGADHRNILDTPECSEAVLRECCSFPKRYLEIWMDQLVVKSSQPDGCNCLPFLCSTIGVDTSLICVEMSWRGATLKTEPCSVDSCRPESTSEDGKVWKKSKFVIGVAQTDLDKGESITFSVTKTFAAVMRSSSPLLENTEPASVSMGQVMGKDAPKILNFDQNGEVSLKCRWCWYGVDKNGMPNFQERLP